MVSSGTFISNSYSYLTSSVEFSETNYKMLYSQSVAYLNLDTAISANLAQEMALFDASGSPSLQTAVQQITKQITLPGSSKTVFDIWNPPVLYPMGTGYCSFYSTLI